MAAIPPSRKTSSKSIGNLDNSSYGMGGTDGVRIQPGTGDFLSVSTQSGLSGSDGLEPNKDISILNVGAGAGVYARSNPSTKQYFLRRIQAGSGISVREVGDSIFISQGRTSDAFLDLRDVPKSFVGQNGKTLIVDEDNGQLVFSDVAVSFLSLNDTPKTFAGQDGKVLIVNEITGKLEFANIDDLQTRYSKIVVSPNPPVAAKAGDAWWSDTNGSFFIYYVENGVGQWVESGG